MLVQGVPSQLTTFLVQRLFTALTDVWFTAPPPLCDNTPGEKLQRKCKMFAMMLFEGFLRKWCGKVTGFPPSV